MRPETLVLPSLVDVPVLRLPFPGEAPHRCVGRCEPLAPIGPAPSDPVERAVHRWFLGHHGAFLAWRFIVAALEQQDVCRAANGFDTYTSMLRYSGSCSREVYDSAIRPMMMAAHPAFSGRWARDYERIPVLLRELRGRDRVLADASRRNLMAHRAVQRKLVPSGPSLLRESGRDVHAPPTDAERDLFDEFFLVHRGSCCEKRYHAQVSRVFAAVLEDLDRHPLPKGAIP